MRNEEHRGLVLHQALHETEGKETASRAGLRLLPYTVAGTHLLYVPWSEVLTRGLQNLMNIGSWEGFGQRKREVWACLLPGSPAP